MEIMRTGAATAVVAANQMKAKAIRRERVRVRTVFMMVVECVCPDLDFNVR
jgi:hypothetical protein